MFSRGTIIITTVFLVAAAFMKSQFPTFMFATFTGTMKNRDEEKKTQTFHVVGNKTFSRPSNLASACRKMFSRGLIIITTALLEAAAFGKSNFPTFLFVTFTGTKKNRDEEKETQTFHVVRKNM